MDPLVDLKLKSLPGTSDQNNETGSVFWNSLSRIWKPKSTATAKFHGPGTRLKFDRGETESPLVYACRGTLSEIPDASLIESGLPVSASGKPTEPLPYWPSYRSASPAQRSKYIDWILGGRCDPNIDLGYVFIYFYGLERRAIIERADHPMIVEEILRLLRIYGDSRSFRRYASSLLWTTVWMSLKSVPIPFNLISEAIAITDWTDETLNTCLAGFLKSGKPLPEELVYRLAQHDIRSPKSILVKRHSTMHQEAFLKKFRLRYPDGFVPKAGKKDRRLEYHPASMTLGRIHDVGGPLADERIPNVLGITSQFAPLVSIWSETIEDLKSYDRASKKAAEGQLTADMYEALPEYLQEGDHPHFEAWYELMNKSATEDGWIVLKAGALAIIEGLPERKKLTKGQSIELSVTAYHMGFAFEPDARITGKPLEWEQSLSIFPATDELSQDIASYHAAAVILELGIGIAAADGQIDELELGRLTSHLESQFDLSTQDSVRLEHLQYLLRRQPPTDFTIARSLQKHLNVKHRKLLGEFLVGIAAVDDEITGEEVKALGKAYRALGLAATDLNALLQTVTVQSSTEAIASPTERTFRLDINRINSIMQETALVTEFLRQAMRDEEMESESNAFRENDRPELAPPESPIISGVDSIEVNDDPPRDPNVTNPQFPDLPNHLHLFLKLVLAKDCWSRNELTELARDQKLMLLASVEQINEWSYDRYGDAILIDADDVFEVQSGLLS